MNTQQRSDEERLQRRLLEIDDLPAPRAPGLPESRPGSRAAWIVSAAILSLALVAVITGIVAPSRFSASSGSTVSPSPSQAPSPSSSPTPSRPPVPQLPRGACTTSSMTAYELIDSYLSLTISADQQAVRDCFDSDYLRTHGVNTRWSDAGPITQSSVQFASRLRGCDWFRVEADFAHGNPDVPAQGGSKYLRFIAVGSDRGAPRIKDQATALVRPEFENDPSIQLPDCRT